jgi:protein-serine/threonine kinase
MSSKQVGYNSSLLESCGCVNIRHRDYLPRPNLGIFVNVLDMSLLSSSNEKCSPRHSEIYTDDDKQSLLSREESQMKSPFSWGKKTNAVESINGTKDTCQKHRLPSWSCQSDQSSRRRKSSSNSLERHDPDMHLPFDTILSTFSAWFSKIKIRRDSNGQQLLWQKYDYQEDIFGDLSSNIRICLVRAKSMPSKDRHNKPGEYFAVKLFVRPRQPSSLRIYLRRVTAEFCIAHTLQHPNILRAVELLSTEHGDLCQVMEFCDAGSLLNVLERVTKLDSAEADCFIKQLLDGVQYMHSVGVAHRNLKPENILLTRQGTLKITDFCYAECFQMPWASLSSSGNPDNNTRRPSLGIRTQHQDLTGTIPFMPPEQFARTTFDPAAGDMWAVGIIYFAMRSGRLPWRRATEEDVLYRSYVHDLEGERCNKFMELVSGVCHQLFLLLRMVWLIDVGTTSTRALLHLTASSSPPIDGNSGPGLGLA